MIASTASLAGHILVTSFKLLSPVGQALGYVLPYFNAMASKINFNTKHLAKGDPLPPYTGKLRVYNMRFCPYAQRTILALNAKQIDYEVVNINLANKPEWLTSKSAFGKVPSLEIEENVCIYESLITVEYLDDVYPQRPLMSKDPVQKAMDKIIVEAMSPVYTLIIAAIKSPDSISEAMKDAYYKALDFLQEQLKKRGTKFLGGSEPGFADYMIWPWFERIHLIDEIDGLSIDSQKYKPILDYFGAMLEDPAVRQYLIPKEVQQQFVESYKRGQPINYDLLLEQ